MAKNTQDRIIDTPETPSAGRASQYGAGATPGAAVLADHTHDGTYNSGALLAGYVGKTGDHTATGQITFTNATAPIIAATVGPSSTQRHTLPVVASDTVALLAAAQILSNKTFVAPVLGAASATSLEASDYLVAGVSITPAQPVAAGDLLAGSAGSLFQFDASTAFVHMQRSSNDASGFVLVGKRSRGDMATPLANISGDNLFLFRGQGHDGTTSKESGRITFAVDGVVSTGIVPGKISLYTANSAGTVTERMWIDSAGVVAIDTNVLYVDAVNNRIGINTSSPTSDFSFGGNVARTIWMERGTVGNTAGFPLAVQAGGATASATNQPGGDLIMATGVSTGTGGGKAYVKAPAKGATGTADNALVNRVIINGVVNLTTAVAATVATVTTGALQGGGGHVVYSVFATDGTDIIEASGQVAFSIVNKAGVYLSATSVLGAEAQAKSDVTDTIVNTWAFAAAGDTLQITSTLTGLTATTFRITYTVLSHGNQAVTVP